MTEQLAVALYLPYAVYGVLPITRQYEVSPAQRLELLAGVELPDYYAMLIETTR
jgi:hypothetical protein